MVATGATDVSAARSPRPVPWPQQSAPALAERDPTTARLGSRFRPGVGLCRAQAWFHSATASVGVGLGFRPDRRLALRRRRAQPCARRPSASPRRRRRALVAGAARGLVGQSRFLNAATASGSTAAQAFSKAARRGGRACAAVGRPRSCRSSRRCWRARSGTSTRRRNWRGRSNRRWPGRSEWPAATRTPAKRSWSRRPAARAPGAGPGRNRNGDCRPGMKRGSRLATSMSENLRLTNSSPSSHEIIAGFFWPGLRRNRGIRADVNPRFSRRSTATKNPSVSVRRGVINRPSSDSRAALANMKARSPSALATSAGGCTENTPDGARGTRAPARRSPRPAPSR